MTHYRSDFLVIGGGIAGLMFALRASRLGKVNLLVKSEFEACSTQYAQGGINAVIAPQDSFESHIEDTLSCGYGLCNEEIVKLVVEAGPDAIHELISYGVQFTKQNDKLSLHREGGHAHNRVVHSKDATGAAIMAALVQQVTDNPNITVFKNHLAIDLILDYPLGSKTINSQTRAVGAYVLEVASNVVHPFLAAVTYLATGGIGKVYPYTSNPRTATGDGIVMAYRAGIEVSNMEFIQFHPTLLYSHIKTNFLISEAIRGEGAILINHAGEAFMERYHPRKELAPRDVVARAIYSEMKAHGEDCVFLDIRHRGKDHIYEHFPNIYETLLALDIDMAKEPIPVVPGAHYLCGGLKVDKNGMTACPGLFAGGECANTGLHGANRLASNSLLEGAVFARRSFEAIEAAPKQFLKEPPRQVSDWVYHNFSDSDEESLTHPLWREVRQFMWNYVGIERTDKRLHRAMRRIEFLRQEIESSYWNFRISQDLVELRNISVIAELIVKSAINRTESRGLHYSKDHPETKPSFARDTRISIKRHGLFR